MVETVSEPELFEESDFATDQTENESSPAVEDTNEQPTSQEEEAKESPAVDDANKTQTGDEIDDFLAKKGVDKSDPDALRKVADMYRNVEKEFYAKSQEKAKLERQMASNANAMPAANALNDPMARIQALEAQVATDKRVAAAREWKQAKNITPEQEAKMVEFLSQPLYQNGIQQMGPNGQPLTKSFLVNVGALSLDDVYRAVGGDSIKAEAVKESLRQAVVKEAAARQTAKSPAALATNSTQFDKPEAKDNFADALLGK